MNSNDKVIVLLFVFGIVVLIIQLLRGNLRRHTRRMQNMQNLQGSCEHKDYPVTDRAGVIVGEMCCLCGRLKPLGTHP